MPKRLSQAPATEPLVTILTDHRTFGRLLANAGLAPDATLAGELVDPFTGLASPDELLAELMADPESLGSRRCETSTGQILGWSIDGWTPDAPTTVHLLVTGPDGTDTDYAIGVVWVDGDYQLLDPTRDDTFTTSPAADAGTYRRF